MIPKIIHYCWFGRGDKLALTNKCIKSWEQFMPEYKIIEWNEENFDVNSCNFTKEAYEQKKWAFVSDYARFYILKEYGGIYFDTDLEVLKPFEPLIYNDVFFGFESKEFLSTAAIAACPGAKIIKDMVDYYNKLHFKNPDGTLQMLPNPYLVTECVEKYGLKRNGKKQIINNIAIYPQIYFSPNTFGLVWNKVPKNSYALHHFNQSWRIDDSRNLSTFKGRFRHYCIGILKNTIGMKRTLKLKQKIQIKD